MEKSVISGRTITDIVIGQVAEPPIDTGTLGVPEQGGGTVENLAAWVQPRSGLCTGGNSVQPRPPGARAGTGNRDGQQQGLPADGDSDLQLRVATR